MRLACVLLSAVSTSSLLAGLRPVPLAASGSCSAARGALATPCVPLALRRAAAAPLALSGDDPGDEDSLSNAFRTLGLPEDASYGEITETYEALSEKFADEPRRLEALADAKDLIVNTRLRQRMAGTLKPEVAESRYDKKYEKPPWTPPWVIAFAFLKKLIELPTLGHAGQVLALMLTITGAAWFTPKSAGMCLMLNCMSGLGFIYNRGLPPVPRDDMGQVGEIRPIKPKPMALSVGITAAFWLAGFLKARQMMASGVVAPWLPELVLRTTFISLGLIFGSLFLRPQAVFEP